MRKLMKFYLDYVCIKKNVIDLFLLGTPCSGIFWSRWSIRWLRCGSKLNYWRRDPNSRSYCQNRFYEKNGKKECVWSKRDKSATQKDFQKRGNWKNTETGRQSQIWSKKNWNFLYFGSCFYLRWWYHLLRHMLRWTKESMKNLGWIC